MYYSHYPLEKLQPLAVLDGSYVDVYLQEVRADNALMVATLFFVPSGRTIMTFPSMVQQPLASTKTACLQVVRNSDRVIPVPFKPRLAAQSMAQSMVAKLQNYQMWLSHILPQLGANT